MRECGFDNTYTWNAEGRPHTVTFGSDSTVVIYDALGNRIQTTASGVTQHGPFWIGYLVCVCETLVRVSV